MVRLVVTAPRVTLMCFVSFNSTMVRLVVEKAYGIESLKKMFQFHYGTIGRAKSK